MEGYVDGDVVGKFVGEIVGDSLPKYAKSGEMQIAKYNM